MQPRRDFRPAGKHKVLQFGQASLEHVDNLFDLLHLAIVQRLVLSSRRGDLAAEFEEPGLDKPEDLVEVRPLLSLRAAPADAGINLIDIANRSDPQGTLANPGRPIKAGTPVIPGFGVNLRHGWAVYGRISPVRRLNGEVAV